MTDTRMLLIDYCDMGLDMEAIGSKKKKPVKFGICTLSTKYYYYTEQLVILHYVRYNYTLLSTKLE